MESSDPTASTEQIRSKDAREPADVLVLYEPTEGDRRWIMLHVLFRDEGSSKSFPEEEPLRLPKSFNDWCECGGTRMPRR